MVRLDGRADRRTSVRRESRKLSRIIGQACRSHAISMNKDSRHYTDMPSPKEEESFAAMHDFRADPGANSRKWLFWGYLLIGGLLIWRLYYIASGLIEVSQDEALFWLQSKHLALSYYSKPPMTALTILLGTSLFGSNDLGVRFFAPVISAILGMVCLRFCARELNARAGFALALITSATPLLLVGSCLMTIDPL